MNYNVYVIKNIKGQLYKGMTSNLEHRLYEHNNGLGRWTKNKGPFILIYSEVCHNKQEALMREKFLKSGQGREFLKKLVANIGD